MTSCRSFGWYLDYSIQFFRCRRVLLICWNADLNCTTSVWTNLKVLPTSLVSGPNLWAPPFCWPEPASRASGSCSGRGASTGIRCQPCDPDARFRLRYCPLRLASHLLDAYWPICGNTPHSLSWCRGFTFWSWLGTANGGVVNWTGVANVILLRLLFELVI